MLLSYLIYLTHAMGNKVLILQTLILKIIDYYYTVVIINIFSSDHFSYELFIKGHIFSQRFSRFGFHG